MSILYFFSVTLTVFCPITACFVLYDYFFIVFPIAAKSESGFVDGR